MAAGDVITIVEDSVGRKGNVFDGVDDYVLHDAHAVARVAANDTTGTYTAWIYPTAAGGGTFLSAGVNAADTEYFGFSTTTGTSTHVKLRGTLKQGGAFQFQQTETTATVPLNQWSHVAIVQDGTACVYYVNGVVTTMTNGVATDLTQWYDELSSCDKFAIGVLESNGTHTQDWGGAIGQVKYWNRALSAAEVLADYNGEALYQDSTYLQFNVTMASNGTTDSGLGADNGTLTGGAYYAGYISAHSLALAANTTGHAAERSESFLISPTKTKTIIVRGD